MLSWYILTNWQRKPKELVEFVELVKMKIVVAALMIVVMALLYCLWLAMSGEILVEVGGLVVVVDMVWCSSGWWWSRLNWCCIGSGGKVVVLVVGMYQVSMMCSCTLSFILALFKDSCKLFCPFFSHLFLSLPKGKKRIQMVHAIWSELYVEKTGAMVVEPVVLWIFSSIAVLEIWASWI